MKEHRHLGIYGLIIKEGKILLIKKAVGPYEGKLDLPGGSPNFGELPCDTLKREIWEETNILVEKYELYDVDSVLVDWYRDDRSITKVHHTGIFYRILDYKNDIRENIEITSINDDSKGACWVDISKLHQNDLSAITVLELEKLGYNID